MKRKRFTTEQIISILKEGESSMPVKKLCRKYGVNDATMYNWKSKYGGMSMSEAKRKAIKHLQKSLGQSQRRSCTSRPGSVIAALQANPDRNKQP